MGEYRIVTEVRTGYLFAHVTGPNTVSTIVRYGADIRQACVRHGTSRVLLVVDLHGPRLSMLEVYKAVAEGADDAAGMDLRSAYVDLNPDSSTANQQIAESVAATRGIPVRTFRDIAAAEAWLLSDFDKES